MNDGPREVELYVDDAGWGAARWCRHPLVNSATLVVSHGDIARFFAHSGRSPHVVTLAERDA